MKIYINTICKNEIENIDQYIRENSRLVDGIFILDTGSTDGSYEKLLEYSKDPQYKLTVAQKDFSKEEYFHFGKARNEALKLLPNDDAWIVTLDLDEKLINNWREVIEDAERNACTIITYLHNFDDSNPDKLFWVSKIIKNGLYVWKNPLHEVPDFFDKSKVKTYLAPSVIISQKIKYEGKSSFYRNILEKSVLMNEKDFEIGLFYLYRDYFSTKEYFKCVPLFDKILTSSLSNDIKSIACLIYFRILVDTKASPSQMQEVLQKSVILAPYRREPYFDAMNFYIYFEQYIDALWAALSLLRINNRNFDFVEIPEAWDMNFISERVSLILDKVSDHKLFEKLKESLKEALNNNK